LVASGAIKNYVLATLDENGNIDASISEHATRTTERLTIELSSGDILQIDTFCSGCAQNTTLHCVTSGPSSRVTGV